MSEVKVNKISPSSGTAFTLGDSGDTFTVPSGGTIVNSGTATGFGGGKIGQVVQTYLTATQSTTSTSMTDITGFNVAITPGAASSKILVIVVLSTGLAAGKGSTIDLLVDIDSGGYNSIGMGDATGVRTRGFIDGHGQYINTAISKSGIFLHSPSYTLTDEITYKLQWYSQDSATQHLNIAGTNDGDFSVVGSGITVMEVLA